ncbi:speckle-type POZ protein-like [Drosophila innubila]|uniref:speckle-type POZ protein-like n=1 Tax=Drosophila innubila TaxID=198719 RepID=UPI00148C3FD8|nr:speckle-type POZ protein-like [Drosophila innubila]
MNWCETSHEIQKIIYTWTIKNYELLHYVQKDKALQSPEFPNDGSGLQLYLKLSVVSNATDQTAVMLYNTSKNLTHLGKVHLCFGRDRRGLKDFQLPKTGACNYKCYEDAQLLKSAASDSGNLIINCDITLIGECTNKSGPQENLIKVPNCKLVEDLVAMLETKELTDVTIVTADGHKIPVHKNILSARSKVFAAMFKHAMQENTENCVAIKEFNFDVVSELIRFMYSGEAPNLKEMSGELLAAAEKYQLDRLKMMCAKFMADNLSIDNADAVLKSADLYNLRDLQLKTIQYIQYNIEIY